jgi:hypothetical protein
MGTFRVIHGTSAPHEYGTSAPLKAKKYGTSAPPQILISLQIAIADSNDDTRGRAKHCLLQCSKKAF